MNPNERCLYRSVRSEGFDFDTDGDPNGYSPRSLSEWKYSSDLFFDIVRAVTDGSPNAKQTDWGCFVMKMSKDELIAYLGQEKYTGSMFSSDVRCLLNFAKGLPDGEYLLTALESPSMEY